MNKVVTSALLAATVAGAGLAFSALPAAADIVCNSENQCWHYKGHYAARPEFGVVVHPDNWKWGRNDHYTWHEHAGRGYWRGGAWISF